MIFNRYIREGKREGRLKKQFFSIRSVVLLSIRKDKKRTTKANYNSRCKARPVSAGRIDDGEFDPGSERTLAARFKHASRANGHLRVDGSGGRVSNTWVICPGDGNSTWKHVVMPDTTACTEVRAGKGATAPPRDEPAAH